MGETQAIACGERRTEDSAPYQEGKGRARCPQRAGGGGQDTPITCPSLT